MNVTRRTVLAGSAAALASAALPALAAPAPVLFGDGKHDDTVALNAFFAGDDVRHNGETINCRAGGLPHGHYLTSGPIHLRVSGVTVKRSMFEHIVETPKDARIAAHGDVKFHFDRCVFCGAYAGAWLAFLDEDGNPVTPDSGPSALWERRVE